MTAVMPTSKNGAPQFSAFSKILQTTRLPPAEDNWKKVQTVGWDQNKVLETAMR